MKDALIVAVLSLTPRRTGARGMGWLARTRVSRLVVRLFARAYRVDLDEAVGTLADYPTLEDFFTRALVPGARPVDEGEGVMVCPVDGRIAAIGRTRAGRIEVAPGRTLNVPALLDEPLESERDVAVLYLSPRDYHRVHVPYEGEATRWCYVPGTLWPVFPAAVQRVEGLFSRNERARVSVDTDRGRVEVVLVGAFGVGRISLSVCDLVTNTHRAPPARQGTLRPAHSLHRGAELGRFHLGSTVVVIAEPDRWAWAVGRGDFVRVGQPLGHPAHERNERSGGVHCAAGC